MKTVLYADMQLSTRSSDCWSAHILSAINGLTQSYIFKQKLQNCEHIDLSRFFVNLRERHLEYWTHYSETHLREHNSKRSTYHQWSALPSKRALVTQSPYIQLHVSYPASWCHSQYSSFQTLCSHPTFWESDMEIKATPPHVTCMILMMSKMSSMFFSSAPIPTWFFSAGNIASLFPQQEPTMCLLLS